jgi:hypothetical protein
MKGLLTSITRSHREKNLANVHTGDTSIGLSPSTTHTSLQSIGTGTGQHLIDADDMVWVSANSEMETFLSGYLDQVPITKNVSIFGQSRFCSLIPVDLRERTYWHKYEPLQVLQMTAARTRWTPCGRTKGTHRRWRACDQDQRS